MAQCSAQKDANEYINACSIQIKGLYGHPKEGRTAPTVVPLFVAKSREREREREGEREREREREREVFC